MQAVIDYEHLMGFLDWLKRKSQRGAPSTLRSAEGRFGSEDENEETDPFDPFPEPVRIEITDVFDLHTIQPKDVRAAVEAYLQEAYAAGFRSVRIIHGKGLGVQREIVRSILARTSFVEDFVDAPPEAGGWGATIAHLAARGSSDIG
jgi:dsDNA-specific endonuclease/ATPase MutS2